MAEVSLKWAGEFEHGPSNCNFMTSPHAGAPTSPVPTDNQRIVT